jgi:aminoglycoside phosphotransferase family enzyme
MNRLIGEMAARTAEQVWLEIDAAERANKKRKQTIKKQEENAEKNRKFDENQRFPEIFWRAALDPSEENKTARCQGSNI